EEPAFLPMWPGFLLVLASARSGPFRDTATRRWRPSRKPVQCVAAPHAARNPVLQVTRILAVRHGETAWNRDTRIQRHTDIALNPQVQWQASQLAEAQADEPIAAVYASDVQRAQEAAQAVARVHNKPVSTHTGLRERGFGRVGGHTWAE